MAADGMQFPWRWNGDTISLNLDAIWGMSDEMKLRRRLRRLHPLRVKHRRHLVRTGAIGVSFPKSGRTWLRMILEDFYVGLPFSHAGADELVRRKADKGPHEPSQFLNRPVVFLRRDPRDTVVSYYHDAKNRFGAFDGDLKSFIRHPRAGIEYIAKFNLRWLSRRDEFDQFLEVSYEKMHENPVQEVRNIIEFLGLSGINDESITRACENNDFDRMRQREVSGELGSRHPGKFSKRGASAHAMKCRRGQVAGFINELDADDILYCRHIFKWLDYPTKWLAME